MKETQISNRNQSIDLIKIIAMFGVIALHVFIEYIDYYIVQVADNHTPIISIPLFFMVSGYLMTSKTSLDWSYVWLKIKKIVIFVTTILIIFHFARFIIYHQRPEVSFLIQPYLQQGKLGNFWYFGAMILIYAISPFLIKIVRSNYIIPLLVLGCMLLSGVFVLNFIYDFEAHIIQSLRIYTFSFYFLLGGVIQTRNLKVSVWCVLFSLLCVELFVFTTRYFYNGTDFFRVSFFYPSLISIFASFCIFSYCNGLPIKGNKYIAELSKLFLPVYTIHPLFIFYLRRFDWSFFYGVGVLIEYFIISLLSILFSYYAMKLKIVAKIFSL